MRDNAAKKIIVFKSVTNFRFFKRLRLIGGPIYRGAWAKVPSDLMLRWHWVIYFRKLNQTASSKRQTVLCLTNF